MPANNDTSIDRYKVAVNRISTLMRDQIEHPLDRAVFSIEYVIRHDGAPQLRSASRKLMNFQRGLLDVTFILTALTLALVALLCYSAVRFTRFLRLILLSDGCTKVDLSLKKNR